MNATAPQSCEYYFAPMEGITGYRFRSVHHELFPEADRYYAPFVSPTANRLFTPKELRDVAPENNSDIFLVPQILTNRSELMIAVVRELHGQMGYPIVNLNLGCPSGTVVSKGKGAGFLAEPEALLHFLDEVFEALGEIRLSVKTRIGLESADEFPTLLSVFMRFPIEELIIHPRTRRELYHGAVHTEVLEDAAARLSASNIRLCVNGNLFTAGDTETMRRRFLAYKTQNPSACVPASYMFGRGLVANPALIRELRQGGALTLSEFMQFHARMYAEVQEIMSGERNILFRMKEYWNYWSALFTPADRCLKQIRKSQRCCDYEAAVRHIVSEYPFSPALHFPQ